MTTKDRFDEDVNVGDIVYVEYKKHDICTYVDEITKNGCIKVTLKTTDFPATQNQEFYHDRFRDPTGSHLIQKGKFIKVTQDHYDRYIGKVAKLIEEGKRFVDIKIPEHKRMTRCRTEWYTEPERWVHS